MKIIHCADIHLDSKLNTNLSGEKRKRRGIELLQNFVNMIEYARNNGIEAIIIAGDLFDSGAVSKTTVGTVRRCIELNENIDFYYLKGNHDDSAVFCENRPGNLKEFSESWISYRTGNTGKIVITGAELKKENNDILHNSLMLSYEDINIVVLHGQVANYRGINDAETINLNQLRNHHIDYLALGHIHSYVKEKLDSRGEWCYAGCLEGRGFDECGQHGFAVIDIDEQRRNITSSFVPFGTRNIYIRNIDISECLDSLDCVGKIRKELKQYGVGERDMVKVVLCGEVEVITYDTEFILREMESEFFHIRLEDEVKISVDLLSYMNDVSLKGEFIRVVMDDETLTYEEKNEIIRVGFQALAGEEY